MKRVPPYSVDAIVEVAETMLLTLDAVSGGEGKWRGMVADHCRAVVAYFAANGGYPKLPDETGTENAYKEKISK